MVRFDPANSAFFAITIAAAGLAQIASTPLVLVTAGWIVALSAIWVSRTAFDFLTSSIEQARIYNSNPAPTCLIDTYFRIRRTNDAFSVLLGLEKSEVIGKLCWLIMPGPSCATSKCPMLRILDGENPVEMEEDREARDGQVLACSIQASPFHDKEGKITGIILTVHDISERKRLERHLAHSATHDPLTDLPNRTLFLDRLSQAIARAKRTGQRLATIFIDLDRFKEINDTLGHEAGDRLLQEIALGFNPFCARPIRSPALEETSSWSWSTRSPRLTTPSRSPGKSWRRFAFLSSWAGARQGWKRVSG